VLRPVPRWVKREGLADDPRAVAGAKLFAETGCLTCHTYLGSGERTLGGGDLSSIGRVQKTIRFFERYIADPRRYGNKIMPVYGGFGSRNIRNLAAFLAASKGPQ
jgi:mono/diheme cytochrome c family protein